LALNTTASTVSGPQDAALRALVKLNQLLPIRLKRKWNDLQTVTLSLTSGHVVANPKTLTTVATACRDQRRLQFRYGDRMGKTTGRDVEPMRLVHTGLVWYLLAWDVIREDWRTFRVDRIDSRSELKQGAVFTPRTPPTDFLTMVSRSIASVPYRYRARLKLSESLLSAKKKVPHWLGTLEAIDHSHCLLTIGADSYEVITSLMAQVSLDFELFEPNDLRLPILGVLKRLTRNIRKKPSH
jgi:predicted DNA-binding transcriptional regulator YafY